MRIETLMEALPTRYTPADRELIQRAFRVADEAHKDQFRASGEPYVNHCLAVALILAEMHVPPEVIAAGLLHDTVEDTGITLEDLTRDFGEEIARLVDGVTKLTSLPRVSRIGQARSEQREAQEAKQAEVASRRGLPDPEEEAEQLERSRKANLAQETLRKTFLAMSEDVRVVLIKLADRLHNMRTLGYVPERKRRRIARQTLDIFAPLASRLGIWQMKWELEDLAFRHENPDTYREIAAKLAERRSEREEQLKDIVKYIKDLLAQNNIEAEVSGRPKHIYSIFKKMSRKGVPFEMVRDVRGIRIMAVDIPACYSILGLIHTHWRPIPGEFDDYIAAPKDNFYRSLHTAVLYDDGKTLEVQIRTQEMHQSAEYGIAAHWRYKEGVPRDRDYEARVIWLRQLMEWMQDVEDATEFVDSMKTDVFSDRVYAFTPRGDIIDLPTGSTPIDFAYHVHTDVGHRCRGAKINGKLVSLDYKLKTGDQVEILTAKRGGPSRDWLNPHLGIVHTQRARTKVRRWFKYQDREQNISIGKAQLDRELRRLNITDASIDGLAKDFEFQNTEDFYEAVGCGDLSMGRLVNRLTLVEKQTQEEEPLEFGGREEKAVQLSDGSISILGLKGLLTTIAKCCKPAPGDEIIGYITRGRGATIHRSDCPNAMRIRDRERLVKVSWGEAKNTYPVAVRIKAFDREGLMRDVSTVIAEEDISMSSVSVNVQQNQAVFDLILNVDDIAQLSRVLSRVENLPNVLQARRVKPG
ncbi:MAG: bifunctional (p)ppGpp synthetase/guanosine-3',5'-bis(diphosphate) 3'-pyrophosphohydrolase [Anaerolineales bacterium]|nr:bifunctional (p)ppGpp synthetase/guanosine-3',5'-bis(diphosphate) 3'-pyrophosphohydrolase [Anaerolineales bacterium]